MVKPLLAMVIDYNPDISKRFITVVDKIFTKVSLQNSPEDIEKEYQTMRPMAVFINLNIEQRESGLAIVEKILTNNESPPLIFAYVDGHEPELIAHCFENGIIDVFMRPFDADLIASKVNRAIRSDQGTVEKNLIYTKLYKPLKTIIHINCRLRSVDENGLTFTSDHYINKGTKFTLDTGLIEEIFGQLVTLMVTKTWFDEVSSTHFLFAEPKDQKESHNASLRRFIMRKNEN